MNKITLVYAYYNNPQMLESQIASWNRFEVDFDIIIVDDGSREYPLCDVKALNDCKLNMHLYRVVPDIPWNQDGARNLAMAQASGWCYLTDIDHVIPPASALAMANMDLSVDNYYVPMRYNFKGAQVNRHPNSYLIHRNAFWSTGGYDEDFCGWYSGDILFRSNRRHFLKEIDTDMFWTVVWHRKQIADSATNLGRKKSEFDINNNPLFGERVAQVPYIPQNPIRFEWHLISLMR